MSTNERQSVLAQSVQTAHDSSSWLFNINDNIPPSTSARMHLSLEEYDEAENEDIDTPDNNNEWKFNDESNFRNAKVIIMKTSSIIEHHVIVHQFVCSNIDDVL